MSTLTSDLPTLLGVSTGIAVLAGLICLVLHLFSKTKYPRHRHFTDNNLPPPIMYSSDTGNWKCCAQSLCPPFKRPKHINKNSHWQSKNDLVHFVCMQCSLCAKNIPVSKGGNVHNYRTNIRYEMTCLVEIESSSQNELIPHGQQILLLFEHNRLFVWTILFAIRMKKLEPNKFVRTK